MTRNKNSGVEFFAELVEMMGEKLSFEFIEIFGGQQIYVPNLTHYLTQDRNRTIASKWLKGASVKDLASENGLTMIRIRQVLSERIGPSDVRDQKREEMAVSAS